MPKAINGKKYGTLDGEPLIFTCSSRNAIGVIIYAAKKEIIS